MRRIGFFLIGLVLMTTSCKETLETGLLPEKGEVCIKLNQDSGTVSTKTDDGLPEVGEFVVEVKENSTDKLFFKKKYSDAIDQTISLNSGTHNFLAYYGDPLGSGFNSCYYRAETDYDVIPDQLNKVELTARLANVKVAVKFGPSLAFDHKNYYAEILTITEKKIIFKKNETRCAYAPVGGIFVALYVHVQDKWYRFQSEPVICESNDFITFNLDTERSVDLAAIEVVIDRGTEEVVKTFEVPAAAAAQEAPSLTVEGFQDKMLSVVEGTAAKHSGIRADIVAMGGISNCVLKVNSTLLNSAGFPESVDLATISPANQRLLEGFGVDFLSDMAGKRLSYIDFSGLLDYISVNSQYNDQNASSAASISMEVVDTYGKKTSSQTYTVTVEKAKADLSINNYDIWTTKILNPVLNVTKGDPSKFVLKCVAASDIMYSNVKTIYPASINGNEATFDGFTGLNHGTTYKVWYVYNNNAYSRSNDVEFSTETALQVGNNSFEQHTYETFKFSISGTFSTGTRTWYQPYAQNETDPWWAVNSTATLDTKFAAGYWYYKCFPTVCMTSAAYNGVRAIMVASIAINDAASKIVSGDAVTGELYIGKADNTGEHANDHDSDGHAFASRPAKMSFYHKFDYHDSPFAAEIKLFDAEDNVIASGAYESQKSDISSWTKVEVPLTYETLTKKAAKIYILFTSSSTGSTDSRDIKLSVLGSNGVETTTENVHAGNVVWLDYVQLHY